jgi:hypothetical protein
LAEALETWLRRSAATAPGPTPELADTVAMLAADVPAARLVAGAVARPNASRIADPRADAVALQPSPPTAALPAASVAFVAPARADGREGTGPSHNRRLLVAAFMLAAIGLLAPLLALGLVGGDRGGPGQTAAPAGVALVTPSPSAAPAVVTSIAPSASPSPTASPTPSLSPAESPSSTPSATPTAAPTPAPTPIPTPRRTPTHPSGSAPAQAVAAFYDAVAHHRWSAAIVLWSPRMQRQYPPDQWLVGRFEETTRIEITRLVTESIDRGAGTARVAVSLTEHRTVEPSPRQFAGSWDLVRSGSRWLLDQPHF